MIYINLIATTLYLHDLNYIIISKHLGASSHHSSKSKMDFIRGKALYLLLNMPNQTWTNS